MKLSMPFKDYLTFLKTYSNIPLTLNRLTLPFGIISDSTESNTLLVGHILDDLAARLHADEAVDCIDVAAVAYELGHEEAGTFLDKAPVLIYRMSKLSHLPQIH
jgi:hypothetical protein